MIKTEEFVSNLALDIWKQLNDPYVAVLHVHYPSDTFSYEVSARLPRPKIKVTYLEFGREF